MTATAPLFDPHPQPALFESLLELIRRTSTILPDDVVRAVTGARKDEVTLKNALPSSCADLLAAGEIDFGLVPTIEYQRIENVTLVP